MEKVYEIKCSFTNDDIKELADFIYEKSVKKRMRITACVIEAISAVILGIWFFNTFGVEITIFLEIILMAVWIIDNKSDRNKKSFRKTMLSINNVKEGYENTFIFTEEEIHVENCRCKMDIRYEAIEEILENDRYFFIKVAKKSEQYVMINKYEMEDLEIESLRDFLNDKTNKCVNINNAEMDIEDSLFSSKYKLNKDIFKEYTIFYLNKINLVLYIFFLTIILLIFTNMQDYYQNKKRIFLLAVIIILIITIRFILVEVLSKIDMKRAIEETNGLDVAIYFKEDSFVMRYKKSDRCIKYNSISKIYTRNKYFIIRDKFNKKNIHVIPKDSLINIDAKEFKEFIKNKMKSK